MLDMQILRGNASPDGEKIKGERYVKEERELFRKKKMVDKKFFNVVTKMPSRWTQTQGAASVSSYEETKHKETQASLLSTEDSGVIGHLSGS